MDSAISPSSSSPVIPVPHISVIIPARNEEANLERCLRSLVVQQGIAFEIIIVNDASTDRTREIAESFTRVRNCPFIALNQFLADVRVIDAPQPLPPHWTGKVNALVAAEAVAHGEWLLFTDADTEHLEGSLAAAVAEAESHHADLLSYSPEQLLTGVRQQLIMPLIFGELAFTYSPRRVSDPALPDAAANGQYILARATVHRALGGFSSVATDLLEDVALARRYKKQGRTIRFRLGRGLVRTRMYSSWDELRSGWTKNLALLFPNAHELARKRSSEFYRLLLSLAFALFWTLVVATRAEAGVSASGNWLPYFALVFIWLYTISNFAIFFLRVSRAHFPFVPTLLSIFGLPFFVSLLQRSAKAHEEGTVSWRGRAYHTVGAEAPTKASNPK
jgi:glycosyltransferase involved in cell wall biosynthesis